MSSSILSFDGWRRCVLLRPGVHAWHAVLLLGGVLALIASDALLEKVNPKAGPALAKWQEGVDAEILFLGNSQQRLLDTKHLCRSALNISIGGSDYSTLFAILRGLRPRMRNLNLVVLGFDNLLLHTPAIRNRKGDYEDLLAWGVPWWDIPETPFKDRVLFFLSRNRLLKPVLTGPKLDQPRLADYLTWKRLRAAGGSLLARPATAETRPDPAQQGSGSAPAGPRSDIHKVTAPYSFAPAEGQKKMKSYVTTLKRSHNTEKNRAAFLDMLAYCHRHSMHVALLRTPTTEAFRGSRPAQWDEELRQLYAESAAAYGSEPPLWDEERSHDYRDDQFDDPNHLMQHYIRTILTPRINERLLRFYGATSGS